MAVACDVTDPAVFLNCSVDVGRPFEMVRRICSTRDWLVPLAHQAANAGDIFLLQLRRSSGSAGGRTKRLSRSLWELRQRSPA
jgi:hypothetical protein